MQKFLLILLVCFSLTGISGCASTSSGDYNGAEVNDPIEPFNRAMFAFNDAVDVTIIGPAAKAYRFVLPEPARESVRNFFRNLRSPLIVGNQILQGDISGAGVATARFVINTTVGVAGFFDVADDYGMAYESEDFGQTLAVWGVGDGFYIVLPILGPSTLRDTTGMVADAFADPVRIWAFNTDREWVYYTRNLWEGLAKRELYLDVIKDLRENSLDYYAAVRSIYAQKRRAEIKDQNPDDRSSYDYGEYDDYDEEY